MSTFSPASDFHISWKQFLSRVQMTRYFAFLSRRFCLAATHGDIDHGNRVIRLPNDNVSRKYDFQPGMISRYWRCFNRSSRRENRCIEKKKKKEKRKKKKTKGLRYRRKSSLEDIRYSSKIITNERTRMGGEGEEESFRMGNSSGSLKSFYARKLYKGYTRFSIVDFPPSFNFFQLFEFESKFYSTTCSFVCARNKV